MKKTGLLAGHKQVKYQQSETGVTQALPEAAPDPIASVVWLQIADATAQVTGQK